ncbi:MAG: ABC transporter permease [Aliivibrio sp.]|nr:ABC transporter permease [Aliivibrio sp.]
MSFLTALKKEAIGIFTNSSIVLTMIGGVIFYAFLYPLPYLNQSPEEQKITVVDLDKSDLSRKFIFMANTTQQLNVVEQADSIEQAKQQFLNNTVSGFLVIPYDFSDKLQLGQAPTVAYAGDASYFLVYGTIIEGLMNVGGTLSAEYRVTHMAIEGTPLSNAKNTFRPFKSNYAPVFNRNMGYVEYVVPAVFVLILQQTLLMAVGIRQKSATVKENSPQQLIARFSLFLITEIILASFYFGIVFDYYHITRFSNVFDLLIVMVPFISSVILLGMLLARWLPTTESILLLVLFSSMPIVFSAGFIWPTQLIPNALTDIMHLLPSGFAIDGFLKINQMGAGLHGVLSNISGLYGLCLLYGFGLFISKQK